ncbi:hypothetical protein GE061_003121 [Apolygus lucorum]|uniref:Uncharacterized protein n=1 Tax=Apolygus lucorum TaxID=248454 RepID=A0A8S9X2M2_APOLU|nr:hypothetical protein GE061_003121 [Apolygus lucorum]
MLTNPHIDNEYKYVPNERFDYQMQAYPRRMLYLTIALGLVAAVSSDDSLKPVLAVQLSNLKFLAETTEKMLNDSIAIQLNSVVKSELNCWNDSTTAYIKMVVNAEKESGLNRLRTNAENLLNNVEAMDDAQLKNLQEDLYQKDNSLLKTIPEAVNKYYGMVSEFVSALNVLKKIKCQF